MPEYEPLDSHDEEVDRRNRESGRQTVRLVNRKIKTAQHLMGLAVNAPESQQKRVGYAEEATRALRAAFRYSEDLSREV